MELMDVLQIVYRVTNDNESSSLVRHQHLKKPTVDLNSFCHLYRVSNYLSRSIIESALIFSSYSKNITIERGTHAWMNILARGQMKVFSKKKHALISSGILYDPMRVPSKVCWSHPSQFQSPVMFYIVIYVQEFPKLFLQA